MTRDDLANAFANGNVYAFSMAVRGGESSFDDIAYRMRYGGVGKAPVIFDDLSAHPHIYELTKSGEKSSAAGAYQATWTTWSEEQRKWGWTSFGMQEQNEFFVARLVFRRALDAVIAGRFGEACRLCKQEWTSLPGGSEANSATSKALSTYLAYGGQVDGSPKPQEVKPMAAALLAFLPQLLPLIPALGHLFGSGSEVQQRNVAAATVVGDALVKVTGAFNMQEALEKMQKDPDVLNAARETVHELLPQLMDAGGGGIEGARKFAADHENSRYGRILEVVTYAALLFLLLANAETFAAAYLKDDYSQIAAVIQADIGVGLMAFGFFLGSSLSSKRKDEARGVQ